ncbi:MAG: hypothetical protein ABIT08_15230 [Bacteroidia bacterium]
MQKFVFSFIVLLLLNTAYVTAQLNPNEYEETPPVLMRNEVSFGFTLHSNGWGVDFRKGHNLTVSKKRMIEIELVGMHHSKEIKSVNPYYENSKSFVFGKLNSLTVLRGALGYQRVIAGKAERGGVEIRLNYTGGLSLGFAKPIYLDIITVDANDPGHFTLSTEKSDPADQSPDDIYGRASFTKGFSEINVYPGLYTKLGFSFEYGSQDEDVKIIEAGITFDAYAKTIPIMGTPKNAVYEVKNSQVYFNFYINILYGRKW